MEDRSHYLGVVGCIVIVIVQPGQCAVAVDVAAGIAPAILAFAVGKVLGAGLEGKPGATDPVVPARWARCAAGVGKGQSPVQVLVAQTPPLDAFHAQPVQMAWLLAQEVDGPW